MFKPMLAKQFHQHRDKVQFPVLVQPKIDGIRLLWDGQQTSSRTGKDSLTVPPAVLAELNRGWRDWPLDGELYCSELTFEEISGTLRRHSESSQLVRIQYWIFDFPFDRPYRDRVGMLSTTFIQKTGAWPEGLHYPLILVPTWKADSFEQIDLLQVNCIAQGYEGIMVRDPKASYMYKRTAALLKYKKVEQLQAPIIGFKAGKGKHLGRLGALVVMCPNGKECLVGTGFDDRERETIWTYRDVWLGKFITIEYQEKTKYGVPRFPRYCGSPDFSS